MRYNRPASTVEAILYVVYICIHTNCFYIKYLNTLKKLEFILIKQVKVTQSS